MIPGSLDPSTTPEEAVSAAKTIGLPVILKPARGSGGRGMQYVDSLSRVSKCLLFPCICALIFSLLRWQKRSY